MRARYLCVDYCGFGCMLFNLSHFDSAVLIFVSIILKYISYRISVLAEEDCYAGK